MMLRRLKEDVEKNIAPKEETIIEVGFQFLLCSITVSLCPRPVFVILLLILVFKHRPRLNLPPSRKNCTEPSLKGTLPF